MKSATRRKLRWAAVPCVALSLLFLFAALPSTPDPEMVVKGEAELEAWKAQRQADIVLGRESSAGPRPEGPPNPQISPILVVLSFISCMAAVALFFMTLV